MPTETKDLLPTPVKQYLPPVKQDPNFFMIGGGQKEVSARDLSAHTRTIRVNVNVKTDDRELTAAVPLYEVVMLQWMYMPIGGSVEVSTQWLPPRAKYPRVCVLSLDMIRTEIKRLSENYVRHSASGKQNGFEQVFGKDGNAIAAFFKLLDRQHKAWAKLEDKAASDPNWRMSQEDIQDIVDLAKPESSELEPMKLEDFTDRMIMGDAQTAGTGKVKSEEAPGVEEFANDPAADLQEFLGKQGYDTAVIMDITRLVSGREKITKNLLSTLPSLHGKRSEINQLMRHFNQWLKEVESKLKATEDEKNLLDAAK